MGFREPIDPADMWSNMPPSGNSTTTGSGSFTLTLMPGGIGTLNRPVPARQSLPIIARPGAMVATTCTALAIDAEIIHDSNMYYRDLGFCWPFRNITLRALRVHYQALNGQASRRLTYSLKQLLDKERRRLYDRLPFGQQLIDKYVFEALHRKACAEASESCKKGRNGLSANDLMRSWGLNVEDVQEDPEELVEQETEPVGAEGEPSGDRDQDEMEGSAPWSWGYCAWRSTCDDTDRLERWQQALIRAARRQDKSIKFAVGYVGAAPQDFLIAEMATGTGPMLVIYLHEDVESTDELAARAVATL